MKTTEEFMTDVVNQFEGYQALKQIIKVLYEALLNRESNAILEAKNNLETIVQHLRAVGGVATFYPSGLGVVVSVNNHIVAGINAELAIQFAAEYCERQKV